jgi:hypothetical protein
MTRAPPTYRSEAPSLLGSHRSIRSITSTRPPSYGRHLHDELLSPPVRTSLLLSRTLASRRRSNGIDYISQMLQILTSPTPLCLTLDNNLLYPPPPSNALYHLPRVLTWSGNEIFLARSLPTSARRGARGALASARDLSLYTMRRTPFTLEVALIPRREGLKPAVMRGHRSLLGNISWEIFVRDDKILRYSKGKWKTPEGRVVAREKSNQTQGSGKEEVKPEIVIVGEDVELWMKDLIVACWCSRVWAGGRKRSFARSLMRGQGGFS